MKICKKCEKAIPPSSGKGRPAVFCSPACRRSAELEIRRINRRIEALETRLSERRIDAGGPTYRSSDAFDLSDFYPIETDPGVPLQERLEAEIKHLEARLLEVLAE